MKAAMFSVLLLVFLNYFYISATPKAAIYIDNGMGQTAIDRMMTYREKREMETEILHLLGLPNRPRKINKGGVRKSAPKFLLDIYEKLKLEDEIEDEHGHIRRKRSTDGLNLSGNEQQQIDESDVIMTFESVENRVDTVRHERGKRLWFNVLELPVAEDIVGAELRIYQNKSSRKNGKNQFVVTVYQLVNTFSGEEDLELVTSVNTTEQNTGWLGLNITHSLASWVSFPQSNKGLYLSVHPIDRPGHEVHPEDIGLVTVKGDEETQPFMVAFLKATNHVKPRATREIKSRVRKSDFSSLLKSDMEPDASSACHIHMLYISFKDLKWQDWIIAPDGYGAYYCDGECNFPLNAHMNASNHAIVQTLVHLMQPTRYPQSCCAPTKLTPISVLYYLDDHNVILKKYKQMVVKTCGCR